MKHIPEHTVEEVRTHSDIVDIIGEYMRLQKRGRGFVGLCPFHGEKTPSFHVNPDLGIYKCFGCGKSGNVISFVMQHDNLAFVDAVKLLAKRAGISLNIEDETDEQKKEQQRYDACINALSAAATMYSTHLNTSLGQHVKTYFSRRGFSDDLIKNFSLGYSPNDWQATQVALIKQGYSPDTLLDAGLVISRDDGSAYDRFRGRAMFAIQDAMGRIVGFGARIMTDEKDQPKYINSPQSLVYDKSKILYGLYQAKNAIRQEQFAILVEGYADALTLHQAGFTNTVASSGTALTKDQLHLLSRYARSLAIVYDGDDAGINAAFRGVELALEHGFELSIVTLPAKEDPDSYVRRLGAEAFRQRLKEAPTFLDFAIRYYENKGQTTTAKGKSDAIRHCIKLIALVSDAMHREFLVRHLSEKFGVSEALLYEELRTHLPNEIKSQPQQQRQANTNGFKRQSKEEWLLKKSVAQTATQERAVLKRLSILPEEKELLRVALVSPAGFSLMETTYNVSPETFVSTDAQEVFRALVHAYHHGVEVAGHILSNEIMSNEAKDIVSDILFHSENISSQWQRFNVEVTETNMTKLVADSLTRLGLNRVKQRIIETQKALDVHSDDTQLLMSFIELNKQRLQLEQSLRGKDDLPALDS
ncbi:MAG: DNA primase [Candidatus Kapabacteria bacterium]|nr:DNA primase [Candidatus Kapabacteria bacterium]